MTEKNPKIRALLTAALLILDPRIADKRNALKIVLMEIAFINLDYPCTIEELTDEINRNIVQQEDYLSKTQVDSIVVDSVARGEITKEINDKFALSSQRKDALQNALQQNDVVRLGVQAELIESVEVELSENLAPEEGRALFELLERALIKNVYEKSLDIARSSKTLDSVIIEFDEVSNGNKELDTLLDEFVPRERSLRKAKIRTGITNYLSESSAFLKSFLKHIHHNVLVYQILNLDPDLVEKQKNWFSSRRLYLDTNTVLAFMMQGQEQHSVVREVIEACIALNIQLLVSPFTEIELHKQVSRAKANYPKYRDNPLVMRFAGYSDDSILKTFADQKKTNPALQWEGFIAPFSKMEEILFSYGILLETEGADGLDSTDFYTEAEQVIRSAKRPDVSATIVQHDALNFALVAGLQEKYLKDEKGERVLLLTIDRSLARAQVQLFRMGKVKAPICVQVTDWGDMVLPVQNLTTFVFDDFIGHLAQARFGAIKEQNVIQIDFLETISDAQIDVDRLLRLDEEQARDAIIQLQSSNQIEQMLSRIMDPKDEEEKKTLHTEFQLALDDSLKETDRIAKSQADFEKRLKRLELHKQDLENRLLRTESSWGYRLQKWIERLLRMVKPRS
ncbi:MAG: hypothetical protein KIS80_10200 [Anaerolineales bacterium]|nr:hypothetical protein [Anaerolineales bacterium]